jgi:hypothetical protein
VYRDRRAGAVERLEQVAQLAHCRAVRERAGQSRREVGGEGERHAGAFDVAGAAPGVAGGVDEAGEAARVAGAADRARPPFEVVSRTRAGGAEPAGGDGRERGVDAGELCHGGVAGLVAESGRRPQPALCLAGMPGQHVEEADPEQGCRLSPDCTGAAEEVVRLAVPAAGVVEALRRGYRRDVVQALQVEAERFGEGTRRDQPVGRYEEATRRACRVTPRLVHLSGPGEVLARFGVEAADSVQVGELDREGRGHRGVERGGGLQDPPDVLSEVTDGLGTASRIYPDRGPGHRPDAEKLRLDPGSHHEQQVGPVVAGHVHGQLGDGGRIALMAGADVPGPPVDIQERGQVAQGGPVGSRSRGVVCTVQSG